MCGIVGIVRCDGLDVDRALLTRMADAVRHRGPDDDGFYLNGPVGLGMRRLSIIDLAGGAQPIHNHNRTAWIVFIAEIYNYR
jgi:asparagine synthase (glutamine-hydrolysing)